MARHDQTARLQGEGEEEEGEGLLGGGGLQEPLGDLFVGHNSCLGSDGGLDSVPRAGEGNTHAHHPSQAHTVRSPLCFLLAVPHVSCNHVTG